MRQDRINRRRKEEWNELSGDVQSMLAEKKEKRHIEGIFRLLVQEHKWEAGTGRKLPDFESDRLTAWREKKAVEDEVRRLGMMVGRLIDEDKEYDESSIDVPRKDNNKSSDDETFDYPDWAL